MRQARPEGPPLRPYPSGGAMHSLEFYLAVERCAGLAPGLYRYDAFAHHLQRVAGRTEAVGALLDAGGRAQGRKERPEVLVILASRFGRVQRKYEGIAYSLLLQEVGAVMQTMYLVATALDLAPCALGCGDADLFARATGLRYEEEGSVGEFALG